MDRGISKNIKFLPIFLGGPMVPVHPVWALAMDRKGPRGFVRQIELAARGSNIDIDCRAVSYTHLTLPTTPYV